jgi:transcriptional regulator with XRE-family HTH domain
LRRLRLERGFDHEGIARRLGVPVEHVRAHERGARPFTVQDLVAYVRLFEVRLSSFFETR